MKNKIKSLILMFFMAISLVGFSACGCSAKKSDPIINVSVKESTYYADNKLSSVMLETAEGDTEGTLAWKEPDTILVIGENTYTYVFTPTDTKKFKSKEGEVKVTAIAQTMTGIEVAVNPTKMSGYEAFQTLDATGMVVNAVYNGGKRVNVTEDIAITYPIVNAETNEHLTYFLAGDDKVTLSYNSFSVDLEIEAVGKCLVDEPVISETYVYNGKYQTADISNTEIYTVLNQSQKNAGTYKVYVQFNDSSNYAWKSTNSSDILQLNFVINKKQVAEPTISGTYTYTGSPITANVTASSDCVVTGATKTDSGTHVITIALKDTANLMWKNSGTTENKTLNFIINKANPIINISNYTAEYTGENHIIPATTSGTTAVYYSTSVELNKGNLSQGATTIPTFKNISTTTLYYYALGDSNHLDKAGSIVVKITKASLAMSLEDAMSLYFGEAIKMPVSKLTATGVGGGTVDISSQVVATYYIDSVATTKTNTNNSGANIEGGMPKNAGEYYVVFSYAGDSTYKASKSNVAKLTINNTLTALYAGANDDMFGWKSTNQYTDNDKLEYVEFDIQVEDNFAYLTFDSNFVKTGVVELIDGKFVLVSDDLSDTYVLNADLTNQELEITKSNTSRVSNFEKYIYPEYLGTYSCDTADMQDDQYYSKLRLYNYYGETRFSLLGYFYQGQIESFTNTGYITYIEATSMMNLYIDGTSIVQYCPYDAATKTITVNYNMFSNEPFVLEG